MRNTRSIKSKPINIGSCMKDRTLPSPIHMPSLQPEAQFPIVRYNCTGTSSTGNCALLQYPLKPCDCPFTDSLHYQRHPRCREPHKEGVSPAATSQHGFIAGIRRSLLFMVKTCFSVKRKTGNFHKSCGWPFFFLFTNRPVAAWRHAVTPYIWLVPKI